MTFLPVLKPLQKIEPCAWRSGSTQCEGPNIGKSGLPEFCKRAGCDGVKTEQIMKECKRYTRG